MTKLADQEIEAKYAVLSEEVAAEYATTSEIETGFPVEGSDLTTNLDLYYDTAAYDLIRRGLALRVRKSDTGTVVAVKSRNMRQESAVFARFELECEIDPDRGKPPYVKQLSPQLRRAIQEHNPADERLEAILALSQTRTKRRVYAANDASAQAASCSPLAELSLDRVLVRVPPSPGSSSKVIESTQPVAEFHEMELELLPGADAEKLNGLAKRLAEREGLRVARSSKLETGLSDLSTSAQGTNVPNIQPQMHMAEACRLIWRQQLTKVILLEHGVRASSDPEYVHDMRVAIRRTRTAYELFGHHFREEDIQPLIDELRRLGKLLGRLRDLDVAGKSLLAFAAQLPASLQADAELLVNDSRRKHDAARGRLLQWLDSPRHSSLIAQFMRLASTRGLGIKESLSDSYLPHPVQVRHCMPSVIVQRFERVRAYESLFESGAEIAADQLHALRIECKYLRYALEFNRHLMVDAGEALIDQIELIQDHLGELNDCAVEYLRLTKSKADQPFDGDSVGEPPGGAIVKRRLQDLLETSNRLQGEFPDKFWQFVTQKNRKLLGEAIAAI